MWKARIAKIGKYFIVGHLTNGGASLISIYFWRKSLCDFWSLETSGKLLSALSEKLPLPTEILFLTLLIMLASFSS